MSLRPCTLAATVFVAVLAGCDSTVEEQAGGSGGGSVSSDASTTSSTSSMSSTSSAGGGSHGDCSTDDECPLGKCVPLTPGGYKVCATVPEAATACTDPGGGDQCCTPADCAAMGGGSCYAAADLQFCGGAFPAFNVCVADECQTDADCMAISPTSLCAPAGAFGLPGRACLTAFCHTDADCSAKAAGACLLVGGNPCCSHPAPDGLGCVYPGDCAECPNGTCSLDAVSGESVCGPPNMGCPP